MRAGSVSVVDLALILGEVVEEWDELSRYFVDSRVGVAEGTATHESVEAELIYDRMLRGRFAFVRMILDLS